MDGDEFKRIRHRLGLSAAALGHALGYRGSETNIARTIYRLESGRPIPRPIAGLLVMFDAYGVPRAWAGETEQRRHNARPKWCDHTAFSEATLGADLMGVAMQRIAERRGRDFNRLPPSRKLSEIRKTSVAASPTPYTTDRAS